MGSLKQKTKPGMWVVAVWALLVPVMFVSAKEQGPLACWNFDENDHSVLKDQTGNGHDGEIKGNVCVVPGVRRNAFKFDGDQETYVICRNSDDLALKDALTIEVCIQLTDSGLGWDGIVCKGGGYSGFQLFYNEKYKSPVFYLNTDKKGYGRVIGGPVCMNEWIHLAAVYDASEQKVRMYRNGVLTAEESYEGEIVNYPQDLFIGKSTAFKAFNGAVDELRIYNRALSESEIREHSLAYGLKEIPEERVMQCFESFAGIKKSGKIRLSFVKTKKFSETDAGKSSDIPLSIYRYSNSGNGAGDLKSAKVIFQGMLKSSDGVHYEYVDENLTNTPPVSYTYWISPDGKNFMTPSAKVRFYDPEVWWSIERIEREMDALAADYPSLVQKKNFGATVEGRLLDGLLIGNTNRTVVLIGSVHPSESGPEIILGAIRQILEKDSAILKKIGIATLPCVGLDRRAQMMRGYAGYLRKNINEVDINRNFDADWNTVVKRYGGSTDEPASNTYRGPRPESEPETQAIINLVQSVHPVGIFSCHSIGSICNAYFLHSTLPTSRSDSDYLTRCREFARAYSEGMYGDGFENYYSVHSGGDSGSLGSWGYLKYRIPAFDLELDKYEEPRKVVYQDSATKEMIEEFQLRHANGILNLMNRLLSE